MYETIRTRCCCSRIPLMHWNNRRGRRRQQQKTTATTKKQNVVFYYNVHFLKLQQKIGPAIFWFLFIADKLSLMFAAEKNSKVLFLCVGSRAQQFGAKPFVLLAIGLITQTFLWWRFWIIDRMDGPITRFTHTYYRNLWNAHSFSPTGVGCSARDILPETDSNTRQPSLLDGLVYLPMGSINTSTYLGTFGTQELAPSYEIQLRIGKFKGD